MSYIKTTDKASTIQSLAEQSRDVLRNMTRSEEVAWRQVWCSQAGGWVTRQVFVPIER